MNKDFPIDKYPNTDADIMRPWQETLDERQQHLLASCRQYASGPAAGLPGHMLMLMVAKMADLLDEAGGVFRTGVAPKG